MTAEQYLRLSKRARRNYLRRAERDPKILNEYKKITTELKVRTNKQMRLLKRSNVDYGTQVNSVREYATTNYGKQRLLSANELHGNLNEMFAQNEVSVKFLTSIYSDVDKIKEQEQHRLDRLKELDILPENVSRRNSLKFLRFLGSEAMTAAVDEYGRSDIIVDMAFDVYKREGKKGLEIMERALTEWLEDLEAHKFIGFAKGFNKYMERVGIKIEDYIFKEYPR